MNYEKAYKAVLQTAKQWIKDGCTDKERICLECVFPELRESKDERIRKWLLECVENLSGGNFIEVSKTDVLLYLEKQKERKPGEWSEDDKEMLNAMIDIVSNSLYEPLCSRGVMLAWLKSLRPSWKPSEEQMEALERASTNKYLSAKQFDILVSLYEQLKKLM